MYMNHNTMPSMTTLEVPHEDMALSPLEILDADLYDTMEMINTTSTAVDAKKEQLDDLVGQTSNVLASLQLTEQVLDKITFTDEQAALTNRVVARDIRRFHELQAAYVALASEYSSADTDGSSPLAQLASIHSFMNSHLSEVIIKTDTGEQKIDFTALDDETAKEPAPQQDQLDSTGNNFPTPVQTIDNENNFPTREIAANEGDDFPLIETTADDGNDFPQTSQQTAPVFYELAKKYGISLDENDPQTRNNFPISTSSVDDGNDFPTSKSTNDTGNDFPESPTDIIVDAENDFPTPPIETETHNQATTHSSVVEKQQPEKLTRKQKIKNGLFAAAMIPVRMQQKVAETYRNHQLRDNLRNPQEKEARDRKIGLGIAAGGIALLGIGLIGRHYGWLDGSESITDGIDPNHDFITETPDISTVPPEIKAPTADLPPLPDHTPHTPTPEAINLGDYSDAFTVRFGGGGAELMQQLGVRPEQALEKWQQLAPELLEKFPHDFYSKTDDGSVAGIMRPGELPENVQRFMAAKLGLK